MSNRKRPFSNPETLRETAPESLFQLLQPFTDFFEAAGLKLDPDLCDYDQLSEILHSAATEIPVKLLEILHVIESLATTDGMDWLLQAMPKLDPPWYAWTPADIAVAAWLTDPQICEQVFLERKMSIRSRSFSTFHCAPDLLPLPQFSSDSPFQLEQEIDQAFQARGRGPGTRLSFSWHGEELWIVVRHGEPMKRTACLQDGSPQTLLFRPEGCDFLILNPVRGELRMNQMTLWQRDLYQRSIGQYFFGMETLFCSDDRYTLEPLRNDGPLALVFADQPHIAGVRLTEIRYLDLGQGGLETKQKADDLFANGFRFNELPAATQLLSAKFDVRFLHAKSWRSVTVTTPNRLKCSLESDSDIIEAWLEKRGFLDVSGVEDEHDDIETILAFPRVIETAGSNFSGMAACSGT